VYAHATTTVSVLRGSSTDGFGDTVSADTVAASGIPASILEQRRTVYTPADNRVQQVLYYLGRVPGDTDVQLTDRILDEVTGDVYRVDSSSRVGSPVTMNDLRLDLRKAS
jgi:hypothetical protein